MSYNKEHGLEEYKVVCLCTSHMTQKDNDSLLTLSKFDEHSMIIEREGGYLVKLYGDPELDTYGKLSLHLNCIFQWATKNGYRMVEFDSDANPEEEMFPVFEW